MNVKDVEDMEAHAAECTRKLLALTARLRELPEFKNGTLFTPSDRSEFGQHFQVYRYGLGSSYDETSAIVAAAKEMGWWDNL